MFSLREPFREWSVAVNRLDGMLGSVSLWSSASQGPPFLRDERADLPFAIDDHAEGDGLDSSRRQTELDLQPEQRADLVTDQAVQDAAGLLGVDQLHVDFAGMLEGFLDRLLGDLVEDHAFGGFLELVPAGGRLEVPRDGFALAVRVGGKEDVRSIGSGCLEILHQVSLVFHSEVLGQKNPPQC